MPKPVYIICSEDGAVDATSSLISFFNVIEKIVFAVRAEVNSAAQLKIHLMSVWAKDASDSLDDEFEIALFMALPKGEPKPLSEPVVNKFKEGRTQFRTGARFVLTVPAVPGELVFESRIRKVGTDEWKFMNYSVEVVEASEPSKIEDSHASAPANSA